MSSFKNRVLVLMRDGSAETEQAFVADLYSNNKVEDTVYLDREAILQWSSHFGSQIPPLAARAMDLLMCCPELLIYSIPLCPSPSPVLTSADVL
jgi:hypothetical protein